jgi:hypothetical protein
MISPTDAFEIYLQKREREAGFDLGVGGSHMWFEVCMHFIVRVDIYESCLFICDWSLFVCLCESANQAREFHLSLLLYSKIQNRVWTSRLFAPLRVLCSLLELVYKKKEIEMPPRSRRNSNNRNSNN